MDRSILKDNAKRNLQKNHWTCVAVAFLMTLVLPSVNIDNETTINLQNPHAFQDEFSQFFSSPDFFTTAKYFTIGVLVSGIISIALNIFVFNTMSVGGSRFFLKLRKNQPTDVGEVFTNFKDKTFLNIAKTSFITMLYIGLYSLLLIIPGIIKAYEYAAVSFILAVRPDIEHNDALNLSKEIMKGHKLDLFILDLSFIGWNLLSLFTCGILSILYVNPYKQATHTEFFCFIREDAIARGAISPYDIPDYEPYMPPAPSTPFYSTTPGMNSYPQSFAGQQDFSQAPQNPPVEQDINQAQIYHVTPETNPHTTQVTYSETTADENIPLNNDPTAQTIQEQSQQETEE